MAFITKLCTRVIAQAVRNQELCRRSRDLRRWIVSVAFAIDQAVIKLNVRVYVKSLCFIVLEHSVPLASRASSSLVDEVAVIGLLIVWDADHAVRALGSSGLLHNISTEAANAFSKMVVNLAVGNFGILALVGSCIAVIKATIN